MSIKLEGLKQLEIGDDGLRYRTRYIAFQEIHSVEFTATETKHYVGFIPAGSSYDANLRLILTNGEKMKIRQEQTFRTETAKKNMDAMWRASEIISVATFNHRVERYESELHSKGSLGFGRYQINKDGRW